LPIAVAGIVALRAAAIVFEELLIGIVDAAAGIVEADLVVFAGELGEPVGGLDRVEFAVDPNLFQLVDQDNGRITVGRDVAGGDLDREPLVGAVAELSHDLARFRAVLRNVGTIARNCRKKIGRHAPYPARWRLHRSANATLPLGEDVDEALA